ncbi:MAG: hypothetical protein GC147_00900 [Porphyrobacter sp.]|nr:hypothetical protein [Porphyrobacter sp.]
MIGSVLLLGAVFAPASPFVGEWNCVSAFSSDPFSLTLVVSEGAEAASAEIVHSTDMRLPDGSIRLLGGPEKVDNPYASELLPDLRWQGLVLNKDGNVSFTMLWDREEGLSVNLWQYFSDGSPSKLLGALACTGVEA